MIILDASSILPWFFPDEFNELSAELQIMVFSNSALVPSLWYFEVSNSLMVAVRRNRIDPMDVQAAMTTLSQSSIRPDLADPREVWSRMTFLAHKHGLSAYDATYLELAARKKLPLATLDKKLANAAFTEDIAVFGQDE